MFFQSLHHAGEQAATACRQDDGIRTQPFVDHFIHQRTDAIPQQRVVKGVNIDILRCRQRQGIRIRFTPDPAVDDEPGAFLFNKLSGARRGGFRHHHRDRQPQPAATVGHGNTRIAAGGADKGFCALRGVMAADVGRTPELK